jgi:hypothetical protein
MKRYWLVRIEAEAAADLCGGRTGQRQAAIIHSMAAPQPPEDFRFFDSSRRRNILGIWHDSEESANAAVTEAAGL